jgi:hypothetical protein
MAESPQKHGQGFGRLFERGVNAATGGNILAYGYSVTITAAFGILANIWGLPGVFHIFAFALGAILAFTAIVAVVSGGFQQALEDEPISIKVLGSAFAFLSVGFALAVALVIGWLLPGGFVAWPVGAFLTTGAYVGSVGLEMAVADRMTGSRDE